MNNNHYYQQQQPLNTVTNNSNITSTQIISNSSAANLDLNNATTTNSNISSTIVQPPSQEVPASSSNLWDNDDFDSDQLDEDESYSWASGITDNQDGGLCMGASGMGLGGAGSGACGTVGGGSIANWRDWRSLTNQTSYLSSKNQKSSQIQSQQTSTNQIDKLVDICARFIATNLPFELVETFRQPVPEDLQLKITFSSFPDSIESIRLYSCLSMGNVDEYLRGEQLYNNRCVRKIIQIGFHLSAQVVISSPLSNNINQGNNNTNSTHNTNQANNYSRMHASNLSMFGSLMGNGTGASSLYASVAIVCDRRRIVSCNCTCSRQNIAWCSHIVAVCLYRILEPLNVEYRAPVSESLSKLERDQLQKFAQYLISELPQQILPTAQKLLDELLKSNETSINVLSGAPDPTAGASQNDISTWCLDEYVLQENIHKTLLKFIAPTPNVVSDIECLEHASSATAAEYTSLLRPLRGREPEGMWNLLSIVREMFKKRDKNSIPLLRIITNECVAVDQIVQLWFLVKSSQLYHDKALFNSVSSIAHHRNSNNSNHQNSIGSSSSLTPPVHQACASLMDEIVSLWRISCLNPLLDEPNEINFFRDQLLNWHQTVFERLKKFCNSILNNVNNISMFLPSAPQNPAMTSYNLEKLLKRLDIDLFNGFMSAVNACDMTWSEFDFNSPLSFRQQCHRLLFNVSRPAVLEEKSAEDKTVIQNPEETASSQTSAVSKQNTTDDELSNLYLFDFDPLKSRPNEHPLVSKDKDLFKLKIGTSTLKDENKMEILFARCEALFAHGYNEQSCILAQILASHMLKTGTGSIFNNKSDSNNNGHPVIALSSTNPNGGSNTKSNLKNKCVSSFQNTLLWRSYLLCNILYESSNNLSNSVISRLADEFDLAHEIQAETDILDKGPNKLAKLAFRIGIFGLETPRLPAISKALEVKLINQEQDLVNLLKKFQLGAYELSLVRDRATKLRDSGHVYAQRNMYNNLYYSLPILLGTFIFDTLHNFGIANSQIEDQQLGFESSLSVLGMKANVSESQHSLLCEGIRRQKGDLAITLLLTYKDDEQRLLKIMDKILDRDMHVLFKQSSTLSFNPFNPNFKKIQQQQLHEFINTGLDPSEQNQNPTPNQQQSKVGNNPLIGKYSANQRPHTSAIDSLSSGWEESENESPNLSGDISLLETKYRCLSLRQQNFSNAQQQSLQSSQQQGNVSVLNKETTSSDNSPTSTTRKPVVPPNAVTNINKQGSSNTLLAANSGLKKLSSTIDDSGDDSAESSSSTDNIHNETIKFKIDKTSCDQSQSKSTDTQPQQSGAFGNKTNIRPNKFSYNSLVNQVISSSTSNNSRPLNQPSEAFAHFMFEFSKTVLSKAGGSVSTSVFLNHQNHQPGGGPHRNLHICSFLISLYALGLHNSLQPSWLSRTYSSHVTWVNSQAVDIGFPAICILIECWQGHLTPSECVSLADRVSRGRDNMAVKAAAELALSSLKFANYMNLTEIQRALIQCKEQSTDMLQRACIIVEHAVKEAGSSNLLEILFTIAKRWDELFAESVRQQAAAAAATAASSQLISQPQAQASVAPSTSHQPQNNTPIQSTFQMPITDTSSYFNSSQAIFYPYGSLIQNKQQQILPIYLQQQQQQGHLPQQPNTLIPFNLNLSAPSPLQNQPQPNPTGLNIANAAAVYASYINTSNLNQNPMSTNLGQAPVNSNLFFNSNQSNGFQMSQFINYQQQFQLQNFLRQQEQNQQQEQKQSLSSPIESLDNVAIKHLTSAFRVGMMGLEALPRRLDGSHQIKYRQSPSYSDDVKWLWEVSIKLDSYMKGNSCLKQFCHTAALVIQNPFLIQELVFDSALYLSHNNPNQINVYLESNILQVLVQKCLNLYFRCCMSKLHHLNSNEHEDFINMILTARNIFYYSNNIASFDHLINNITTSNKCKKEIQTKILNALKSNN